jgi:hypothetical protein
VVADENAHLFMFPGIIAGNPVPGGCCSAHAHTVALRTCVRS